MALTKVLITVKTYPSISNKYDELVCTAGFREDGTWIRLYPIPFRKIAYEQQYKKYDWIEIDLVKNTSDFRPESFRPRYDISEIKKCGHLDTKDNWSERKKICLKNVRYNISDIVAEAKDSKKHTSLVVFKPTAILNFKIEEVEREWDKKKLNSIKAMRDQVDLFKDQENPIEVVAKLPYKFSYTIADNTGKESTMMIEDWEIGQLYWNCLSKHEGNESKACDDVKQKYFADFAKTKDLYLFLGTTSQFHLVAPNPFIIIGTFHPKPDIRIEMSF